MEHLNQEIIVGETPGVRLDSWVNENVMITPPLFAYNEIGKRAPDYFPGGHKERIAIHDRVMSEQVPKYSTDITAAWKVVEAVNSRGWQFCIRLTEDGRVVAESGSACNSSSFFHDGDYYETVPEAICKAALMAMLDINN